MRKGFFNLPLVLFAVFSLIAIVMFVPAFIQMSAGSAGIAPDVVTSSYYRLIPAVGLLIGIVTIVGLFFIA